MDNRAAITPPRLTIFPMDKSNSLMVITKVAPKATIANGAACLLMLRKFLTVQKEAGRRIEKIRMITVSAATVP